MDFQDQPITTARSIPWKPVAIAAGGLLVAVLVVILAARLLRGDEATRSLLQEAEELATPALVADFAADHGSLEACELLESEQARDNCAWGVARSLSDASLCGALTDPAAAMRCADGIVEALAIANLDVSACEAIQDGEREARCIALLSEPVTSENCLERATEACDDIRLYEEAVATLDALLCREIVEEGRRESCEEAVEDRLDVLTEDDDEDGLTNEEEARYGTDPQSPDTDDDGYLDGAEIDAGYNPNGPGRL